MRDSIIFYRSFYEAICELDPSIQAEVYTAIFEYSLNFKEMELSGLAKTIFTLIKPQLDANNRRFQNGKKGGRPSEKEPRKNQRITETEPKDNRDRTKPEANVNVNVNVNENENENGKDKELYSEHFDKFWNLYDKKIDRAKCEAKFNRLKKDEVESILKTLPNYVKANPEIKYRKNPLTYLNGKCWMDEIIITGSNNPVEKSQSPPNQYTPFETNGFLFDDYEIPMKDFLYQLPKVLKEDCLSGKYPKK